MNRDVIYSHRTEESVWSRGCIVVELYGEYSQTEVEGFRSARRRKWCEWLRGEKSYMLMIWEAEVRNWWCRGRRGSIEGKKEGWISFPYCMCSRIHHLGEPDVRHSHQTFQIKGPPHPSTPLSNPVSIFLSPTIKPLFALTHMQPDTGTYIHACCAH